MSGRHRTASSLGAASPQISQIAVLISQAKVGHLWIASAADKVCASEERELPTRNVMTTIHVRVLPISK